MLTKLARLEDPNLPFNLRAHEIWTTLEGENPGGSIKDRMVEAELLRALSIGTLLPKGHVSEASAGSTAQSLAYYAKKYNLRCSLFVPQKIEQSIFERLKALGAELHLCDPATGYSDYERFCKTQREPLWRLDQFGRPELRAHYQKWAREEIRSRLPEFDLVIGAVGTGHSLLGVSAGLEVQDEIHSAEPAQPSAVAGIRNLRLESYGEHDPCPVREIPHRVEVETQGMLEDGKFHQIKTNLGLMHGCESFQVTLTALLKVLNENPVRFSAARIFAVGAKNKLI